MTLIHPRCTCHERHTEDEMQSMHATMCNAYTLQNRVIGATMPVCSFQIAMALMDVAAVHLSSECETPDDLKRNLDEAVVLIKQSIDRQAGDMKRGMN